MAQRIAFRAWVFVAVVAAVVALAPRARADAKTEATAKGLDAKAMQEDYLATDFDKALEKLNKAATACGADKCSAVLRGTIKRDIGVVQVAGKTNHDAGVAAFVDAIKADPAIALDPDTKTKEIEAAWAEAKKQSVTSGPIPGAAPSGDFSLTPPTEQQVRTPLPVYVEYGGSEELAKVNLKYKAFGMTEWKSLEMKKLENQKGWGIEVPCVDVQVGEIQFYVQGFNAANDPVANSGDRNNPYKTVIKKEAISGDAPHLPGLEPSKQCADTGDCPPDFPGCKQPAAGEPAVDSSLKDEGDDCEDDNECKSGTCKANKCTEPKSSSGRHKFWLGIQGQLDFTSLSTASDVCKLVNAGVPLNSAGYYCTAGGANYPLRSSDGDTTGAENNAIRTGVSDRVAGGFTPANIRALISFDYAATTNLMIGVRAGLVLNTYPGNAASSFPPLHLEARVTYVIGKDPIGKAGLAPYLMLAGGLAEWDASVNVSVVEQPTGGTPTTKSAQAWLISGPGFGSLGGGLRYGFSDRVAGFVGPRVNVAFGGTATLVSISPELGIQYGF